MAAVRGIEEHIREPGPVRMRPPSKATLGKGQGPITSALIVWLVASVRVEDPHDLRERWPAKVPLDR
jgi:hypothetical protein